MPLFNNPADVARTLDSSAASAPSAWERASLKSRADAVRSGLKNIRRLEGVGNVSAKALGGVAAGVNALLAPAGSAVLRGAKGTVDWLAEHPGVARPLGVAALAAPIIASDFMPLGDRETQQILRARYEPDRVIGERVTMASLNDFLEKKAAISRARPDFVRDFKNNLTAGMAKGVGSELTHVIATLAGKGFGAVRDALSTNPSRKALLNKLLDSDPVISDAVKRNPAMLETLLEAYGTLLRYAPSLTQDTNAVRSFLREVILGGGHVNYATIKNLIETEKALTGDPGKRKGGY